MFNSFRLVEISKRAVYFSMALSLVLPAAMPDICHALSMPSLSSKKDNLVLPTYEKLVEGAGPTTNDSGSGSTGDTANSAANSSATAATNDPAKTTADSTSSSEKPAADKDNKQTQAADLSPLKLDSDKEAKNDQSDDVDDSKSYLKSTVSATGFVPKGPIVPNGSVIKLPEGSVVGNDTADNTAPSNKGNSRILNQAKRVNAMPLPLMPSEEEADQKAETVETAEAAELRDLWSSALDRSPDIQFVIQKLMPHSDDGVTQKILMRMLTTTIFGAMGAVSMMSPNPGVYAGSNAGASLMMSLVQGENAKNARNARLSQTESIMLYNIVRSTADKLVDNYRSYKKNMLSLTRASSDLQDLQGMVADARSGQDAAKQLEMEYTLRKAQRDVDSINEDIKRFRQGLIDLSGSEAVARLDKEMVVEQASLDQTTPSGDPKQANEQLASDPKPNADQPTPVDDTKQASADQQTADSKVADSKPAADSKQAATADNAKAHHHSKTQTASKPDSQS